MCLMHMVIFSDGLTRYQRRDTYIYDDTKRYYGRGAWVYTCINTYYIL